MYKNNKILAVIPARGGSKGLPRKNILELCGKPLVGWTIESAKSSQLIDEIVLSTEDEEIAKVSENCGLPVHFMRPQHLATDEATTFSVIEHVINEFSSLGKSFDVIVLLEPTSPLREDSDR
jgi:CMP-N-acetylneuraminic acid synthetase